MKNIKVVVTDLDSTLLYNDKFANLEQNKYLKELQNKGIKLIFATGRNWIKTKDWALELELNKFANIVVCENGSYITKVDNLEPMMIDYLEPKIAQDIFKQLNSENIKVYFQKIDEQDILYTNKVNILKNENDEVNIKNTKKLVENINDIASFEKITFFFSQFKADLDMYQVFDDIQSKYHEDILIAWGFSDDRKEIAYMISNKNANKGDKTLKLIESLGYKNEEVIFFGDSGNDIPAMKVFINSVAMGNADNEVKKIAKYTTDHCVDGGIMNFLKKKLEL
ncbi:HAD superfamily hydrolase [Spiroplasma helicoides]|uniref:HAD superfamily hydrolase n=1 Tax=Spiroplasma helicoides TaxID=216938 RepID=A0A1B3SL05_9MOLU|nr:HAD family hydrolase [Spiroplasma helicoides]AOG60597.1 HAD superfamily hydrolase [Spiroplasma helicoides]